MPSQHVGPSPYIIRSEGKYASFRSGFVPYTRIESTIGIHWRSTSVWYALGVLGTMLSLCVVVWPTDSEYHTTHVHVVFDRRGQRCLCPPLPLCTYEPYSCGSAVNTILLMSQGDQMCLYGFMFLLCALPSDNCFVSAVVWCLTPLYLISSHPLPFPSPPPPPPTRAPSTILYSHCPRLQALTTHTVFWRTAPSMKPPHLKKVCSHECMCIHIFLHT